MQILFITSMGAGPWGGSEELWSQVAIKLAAQKHDVTASVMYWPTLSPRVVDLESKGVRVHVRRPETLSGRDRLRRKILGDEEQKWFLRQQLGPGRHFAGFHVRTIRAGCNFANKKACLTFPFYNATGRGGGPATGKARFSLKLIKAALKVYGVSRANLELLQCQLGTKRPTLGGGLEPG